MFPAKQKGLTMKKTLSLNKKHIYVVIMCKCPRFITKIDREARAAEWKANEIPYEFTSYDDAWYVCMGLMWRGVSAFPVVTDCDYKQTTPFYSVENPEEYKENGGTL